MQASERITGTFVPTVLVLSARLQDTVAAAGAEGPSGRRVNRIVLFFPDVLLFLQ